jgi:hypothetical protein
LSAPDKIPEAIFLKYFAGGKNMLGRRTNWGIPRREAWVQMIMRTSKEKLCCRRDDQVRKMQHVYLSLLLLVTIIGIAIPTTTTNVFAQSQQQIQTQVFIVGSDNAIHEANLKATKDFQKS